MSFPRDRDQLCFLPSQVYVLNRDSAANLTISSPLEAHKSHNIVFDITGLDCGFDNPIFAAIELDYSDADVVCSACSVLHLLHCEQRQPAWPHSK